MAGNEIIEYFLLTDIFSYLNTGLDKQIFHGKTANIFLSIIFNIYFGCSKKRLIETVVLSSHNRCFG